MRECLVLLGSDAEFYHRLGRIASASSLKAEQCAICFNSSLTIFDAAESCGHKFHANCINKWKKYTSDCPMCRKPI